MILRDEIDSTSKEYVGAPIREGSGINILVDPIEVALTTTKSSVGAEWTPGIWKLIDGASCALALFGPDTSFGPVPAGRYWVKVRVTDSPEKPVLTSPNQVTFY